MRLSLKQISTCVSRLSIKKIALTNVSGHHPIRWEPEQSQKVDKGEFALCLKWHPDLLLPSHIVALGPQAFGLRPGFTPSALCFSGLGTWTELHCGLSWASSLHTADCGTSQPSTLCDSIPIINLLICLFLYIAYSFCFFLENPDWYRYYSLFTGHSLVTCQPAINIGFEVRMSNI